MRAEADVVVSNKMGIHARPASMIASLAGKAKSDVFIEKDGDRIDCKSIMSVMMLAAGLNTRMKIIAEGDDAETIVQSLKEVFDNGFGEEQ
jgi:phosphotransferase system HPr (HPr) family protein